MGVNLNDKVVIFKAKGKKDYAVGVPSKDANLNDYTLAIPVSNRNMEVGVVPTSANLNDNVIILKVNAHKDYPVAVSDRRSEEEILQAEYMIQCVERGHDTNEEGESKWLRLYMYKILSGNGLGVRVIKKNKANQICPNLYEYHYPQNPLILSTDESFAYEGNGDPIDVKITGLPPSTTFIFSCFTAKNSRYSQDFTMACCRTMPVADTIRGFFISCIRGYESIMGWYLSPAIEPLRDKSLSIILDDSYSAPSARPYQETIYDNEIMYEIDGNNNFLLDGEGNKIEAEDPYTEDKPWYPEEQYTLYNYYDDQSEEGFYSTYYTQGVRGSGFNLYTHPLSAANVYVWLHNDRKDYMPYTWWYPITSVSYSTGYIPAAESVNDYVKNWELSSLGMSTSWITEPSDAFFSELYRGWYPFEYEGNILYGYMVGGHTIDDDDIEGQSCSLEVETTFSSPFANKTGGSLRFPFKYVTMSIQEISDLKEFYWDEYVYSTSYNGTFLNSLLTSHYVPNLMFKREARVADEEQELDASTVNVYDFSVKLGAIIPSLEKNRDYKFKLSLTGVARWHSFTKAYGEHPEENYSSANNYVGEDGFGCCVNDLS